MQGVCHISFHSVKYRLMSSLLKYSLLPGKQGKETLGGRGGGGGGWGSWAFKLIKTFISLVMNKLLIGDQY